MTGDEGNIEHIAEHNLTADDVENVVENYDVEET